MGTTYDAIFANSGVPLQTTAVIEGFNYILTDGDPALAYTAYDNSNDSSLSDFAGTGQAIGGLSVHWDMEQRATPFKPFTEPMVVKLSVVPATTYNGSAGAISDAVGQTIFKRQGGTFTHITVAVDCDDTSITVQRADDFAASGTLFAGSERIPYSSRDTGTDTFTVSRGSCSVFQNEALNPFTRTHRPSTYTDPPLDVALQPQIGTEPRSWIGRHVAIWLHKMSGTTSIDAPHHDQSAAHLAFAGMVVGVEDVDGATVITCEDIRRKIYETTVLRDPFRAKVKEGVRLSTGQSFTITTQRQVSGGSSTTGAGNNLTVVAGAPASTNEVQAGVYTCEELADVINEWLQNEKQAGRILFAVSYEALYQDTGGGIRGRLRYNDPTSTAGLFRNVDLGCTIPHYLMFLGWSAGAISIGPVYTQNGSAVSDRPPLRVSIAGNTVAISDSLLALEQPRGTWITQTTLLPQSFRDPVGGLIHGVLRVNGLGYLRAGRVSDTSFNYSSTGMDAFFPGNSAAFNANAGLYLNVTYEDDLSLEVEQVLVMTATFKSLLLRMLMSTGTANFNSATYDNLSESLGCAIPYSIMGDDFVAEVGALDCADAELTAIVRKPTRFAELFEADFILRRIFFVWGQGRLRIGKWVTPNSGFASYTLTETSKATPSGTQDNGRAAMSEDDGFINLVKIKFSPDSEGEFQDEVTLVDAASIRDHGSRMLTINARNSFRQTGSIGQPLDELISLFAGYFPVTSRPWLTVRRTIDFNRFEATYPGTVLALTDAYIRDPATGLRYSNTTATGGLSGYPGMVLWHRFDWGGAEPGRDGGKPHNRIPVGEVDIMLVPIRTQATYCPTAQVDHTAANAGYDSGTKTLTTVAHKFTETSESNDNTFFSAGDEVLVHQIDPSDPATATSWSDVVVSTGTNTIVLTTGLAGFDTTGATLYRVTYDAYATVGTSQKAKTYQADDADGLVVDTVQAYGFGLFGGSQGLNTVTDIPATTAPCRYAQLAYGDGKPLDVGFDTDMMKLANNLCHYKTAPQQVTQYSELCSYPISAGGTYKLCEMQPIFVGMQGLGALARSLSVAPRFRSTDGSSVTCRIRLCRLRPSGATLYDVDFIDPYVSASFTTTSTTFTIPTAQTLSITHLKLSDAANGGWGWLTVEITVPAEYSGISRCVLGAAS